MSFFGGFSNTGYPSFPPGSGPFTATSSPEGSASAPGMAGDAEFNIFQWHTAYQSCQRYFLDHAQHNPHAQAVAALVNICLPCQWTTNPILSASGQIPHTPGPSAYNLPWPGPPQRPPQPQHPGHAHRGAPQPPQPPPPVWVSLVPYVRRLVVTGFDSPAILHGFFGEDWKTGIGPIHECERRNYLFTAKSVAWAKVKDQYDMSPYESVPFLKPLQYAQLDEIRMAEQTWSHWLAMQDWMVGPRAPDLDEEARQTEDAPNLDFELRIWRGGREYWDTKGSMENRNPR